MNNRDRSKYKTLSQSISWMRFPLIFMIVLLHCYCAIDVHGRSLFFGLVYPFGLFLGETGVPAFFFVSGFLFYFSQKSYAGKLQSRVKTLLIPYLFWNSLILLAYVVLAVMNHPMMIAGKSITDYGPMDYVRAFIDRGSWDGGNGVPLLCPYWYIRNLMVLCVVSPAIYFAVKYLKLVFIAIQVIWWFSIPYNGMIASSFLFFSLGAYFSIHRKDPLVDLRIRKDVFFILWLVVFLIDWIGHAFWSVPFGLYWHRLALIMNIYVLLLVGSRFGHKSSNGSLLLDKSAFWIYTVHYPLTLVVESVSERYLQQSSDFVLLGYYWLSVILVTAICLVTYVAMARLFPNMLSYVTGSRS